MWCHACQCTTVDEHGVAPIVIMITLRCCVGLLVDNLISRSLLDGWWITSSFIGSLPHPSSSYLMGASHIVLPTMHHQPHRIDQPYPILPLMPTWSFYHPSLHLSSITFIVIITYWFLLSLVFLLRSMIFPPLPANNKPKVCDRRRLSIKKEWPVTSRKSVR